MLARVAFDARHEWSAPHFNRCDEIRSLPRFLRTAAGCSQHVNVRLTHLSLFRPLRRCSLYTPGEFCQTNASGTANQHNRRSMRTNPITDTLKWLISL